MEKYLYSDRKILENEAELCNDKIKDHTDCQDTHHLIFRA